MRLTPCAYTETHQGGADRFSALSSLITENGGRVVDLGEPKLTHIVIDQRDASRRLELIKRTSKFVFRSH